jgi:putative transposase
MLVDTQGLVLSAKVHSAALQDRAAAPLLLKAAREKFPRLSHVWADQGYSCTGRAWIEVHPGWSVEVVQHPPKPKGVWAPMGAVIDWEALRPQGFPGVLPLR